MTELLLEARELLAAGRWEQARDAAVDVLRANPDVSAAYVLIARAYADAAGRSGRERPLDRAVYWLAEDYLMRARPLATDAEVAGIERMLVAYRRHAPTDRDKRSMGWHDGQRLRIDYEPYGWIDETVVVR